MGNEPESSLTKTTTPSGGLSSYTPSKVHIENTFELGVSRVVVSPQAPPATDVATTTTNDHQLQDYLKPAEENVPWSSETLPIYSSESLLHSSTTQQQQPTNHLL